MYKCTIITDMAYGSCGKGLISGYLAERDKPDTVVNANMQNSGHTYINSSGRRFMFKCLPNSIVSPNLRRILIGPGSVIDFSTLIKEIEDNEDMLKEAELYIHPAALVVSKADVENESIHNRIGSTQTGNGAAIIRRIMRDGDDDPRVCDECHREYIRRIRLTMRVHTSRDSYSRAIKLAHKMQIDGSQGFGLSPYHGMWPYVTTRDCTPAQLCADTGIAIQDVTDVVGCIRTYPIRVANRFNSEGEMVGYSGPCYQDQIETTFKSIGQKAELTTVTKLPRRVFTFSVKQFNDALAVCKPNKLFVNFMNYLSEDESPDFLRMIREHYNGEIYTGWGSTSDDVVPF